MRVRKVDPLSRSDVKKFIQFPFDLYKNNPNWVPQMRADTRAILDKSSHPFYQHSDADFFIAEQQDKTIGRIAAISNAQANSANNQNSAYFYFFECIDDSDVSDLLFNEVYNWSLDRGHNQVYGPKGLLQGDGIGLLVEGFDYLPAVGIAYNYPYYDKLLKKAGFQKIFDYFSGYVDTTIGLSDKVKRVADKVKKRSGFWVREFLKKDEILSVVPELRTVYNEAFGGSEGFSPITEDEINTIAKRMLSIAGRLGSRWKS